MPLAIRSSALVCLCALGAGFGASACAALEDDVHLAPFGSHLSTAGGEVEYEWLGGAVRTRRERPGAPVAEWELHPLVCYEQLEGARSLSRFLVPLGTYREEPDHSRTQVLPLFRFDREPDGQGEPSWRLSALPITLWGEDSSDRVLRGVFPFGGVWEMTATYDRLTFVLFPLYLRSERDGGSFHHVLWPVIGWGRNGRGEFQGHLWPLYGISKPGLSESGYVAWPFFTWSHERLHLEPEKQIKGWMLWPFWGHRHTGTFDAWTTLWPLFGYARDKQSGFWSIDGPAPFIRVQRPGTSGEAYYTRFWPLYTHTESDGLRSTWMLWPIFNLRTEEYRDGARRGEYMFPFWQHYLETDLDGRERGEWTKLWPFFQQYERGERARFGAPTLLPLWNLPDVDEHYAWLWELYRRETNGERVSERSWLGLWRRERDADEEREYVSGLWSRRKYREAGHMRRETSFLFGLLRWRSSRAGGFELLEPAFPGPGWPARVAREP